MATKRNQALLAITEKYTAMGIVYNLKNNELLFLSMSDGVFSLFEVFADSNDFFLTTRLVIFGL